MSLSDPIADLLTRIRKEKSARHRFVIFRPSKVKLAVIKVLQENGFVGECLVNEEKREGIS